LPDAPTLTYIEFTTLAIMHLFATADVDALILEVGIGGGKLVDIKSLSLTIAST
jgi:folylpolyglutamate synthase/dihydropteroate synthase